MPHGANLSFMDQDDNMPNKVTSSKWDQARKQQEDDQRRCSKDALADGRPHYIEAEQNDIKRKTPSDNNDDEAAPINHDRAAAPAWKKGNPTIIAEGGLPLTVVPADEDDRSSLGYVTREDKQVIQHEGISPDKQPESDTKSPNMDEMEVDEQVASLNDAVATLTKDTDPDSKTLLQTILDYAHTVKKTNKLNPAASSSRPSTKAAPPAVAKAENKIAGQTKVKEKYKVDIDTSDESDHGKGDAF